MTFKTLLLTAGLALSAERDCLQESLFWESRGEPYSGQVMVGLVVKHRVLSERFPNSICEVVNQPYQFSYTLLPDLTQHEKEASERAYDIADIILQSHSHPAWQYQDMPLYFHTTSVNPHWNSSMQKAFTINNHIFYSEY